MSLNVSAKLREDRVLLDLIGDKWTMLVFGALCDHGGTRRFNALRRDVAGISQKSLSNCLRRLARNGLVSRRVLLGAQLGVEYSFTELGYTLDAPVTALLGWTGTHADAVRAAQQRFDSDDAPEQDDA